MAKEYLTQDEIDLLTNKIYNDILSVDDKDVAEIYKSKFRKDVLDKFLLEGEEYVQLEGEQEHYVLTSYGRLINTYHIKQIKTLFSSIHNIYYLNSTIMMKVSVEFEKNGWKYDREDIRKRFVDNDWNWSWIPSIERRVRNGEGIPAVGVKYTPRVYYKKDKKKYIQ
tara:strand:+ start:775 stop:1275 length:501 start_codon:yes stop_codon:yes gene_type:complete